MMQKHRLDSKPHGRCCRCLGNAYVNREPALTGGEAREKKKWWINLSHLNLTSRLLYRAGDLETGDVP